MRCFYIFSLWLPLLLPAIVYCIDERQGAATSYFHSLATLYILVPWYVSGVQYVLFALWALFRCYRMSIDDIEAFLSKAPVYFIPFCLTGVWLFLFYQQPSESGTWFKWSIIAIPPACLIYGYMYVCITHGMGWLFQKLNIFYE